MADTIPDIDIDGTDFFDVYTLAGITVGTEIIIQNKSPVTIIVAEKATKPTTDDGFIIAPLASVKVTTGSSGVWVKSQTQGAKQAAISVQEV